MKLKSLTMSLQQNENFSSSNSIEIKKPSWHFLSIMDATVKYSFLQPRGRYLNTYSIDDQKNLFFEITRCESHKMKREGWTWRRIKTSTRVELCTDCPDLRSLWFTQLQYRPLIWFYANSSNSSAERSGFFRATYVTCISDPMNSNIETNVGLFVTIPFRCRF